MAALGSPASPMVLGPLNFMYVSQNPWFLPVSCPRRSNHTPDSKQQFTLIQLTQICPVSIQQEQPIACLLSPAYLRHPDPHIYHQPPHLPQCPQGKGLPSHALHSRKETLL